MPHGRCKDMRACVSGQMPPARCVRGTPTCARARERGDTGNDLSSPPSGALLALRPGIAHGPGRASDGTREPPHAHSGKRCQQHKHAQSDVAGLTSGAQGAGDTVAGAGMRMPSAPSGRAGHGTRGTWTLHRPRRRGPSPPPLSPQSQAHPPRRLCVQK